MLSSKPILFKPFLVDDAGVNSFLDNAKVKAVLGKFCNDLPESTVCKQKSRTSAKPPGFMDGEMKNPADMTRLYKKGLSVNNFKIF